MKRDYKNQGNYEPNYQVYEKVRRLAEKWIMSNKGRIAISESVELADKMREDLIKAKHPNYELLTRPMTI